MHEGPFSFAATETRGRVFCPRAGCYFEMVVREDVVQASIAPRCPRCAHYGVDAVRLR